jgi:DNA polymerase alpha-associated DNA helicase A
LPDLDCEGSFSWIGLGHPGHRFSCFSNYKMPELKATDIPDFATSQLALLDAELQAELTSTSELLSHTAPTALQRIGSAILNLSVTSQRTGLGGKTVLELELESAVATADGNLPEHGIRTGDIVSVQDQPKGNERKKEIGDMRKKGVDGVVVKISSQKVSIALDDKDENSLGGRLWV